MDGGLPDLVCDGVSFGGVGLCGGFESSGWARFPILYIPSSAGLLAGILIG